MSDFAKNLLYGRERLKYASHAVRPSRTDLCPPTPLFATAAREGWPEQYHEHALECGYCQWNLGLAFRIECPRVLSLAQYLGFRWNVPAFRFHLEEDGCARCSAALKFGFVRTLAKRLPAASGQVAVGLRAIADRAAILLAAPPPLFAEKSAVAARLAPPAAPGLPDVRVAYRGRDIELTVTGAPEVTAHCEAMLADDAEPRSMSGGKLVIVGAAQSLKQADPIVVLAAPELG